MRIIIFYEHLQREWEAIQKLAYYLKKDGNEVRVFSVYFELSIAMRYAEKHQVDILVAPWFYYEEEERLFSKIIGTNPQMKIVNLHHEQIGCPGTDALLLPRSEFAKNGVYHLAWGEAFQEKLIACGVDAGKIYITGNIRSDNSAVIHTKKELAEKYGLDFNKKWVLFAESQGVVLNYNDRDLHFFALRGAVESDFRYMQVEQKRELQITHDELNDIPKEIAEKFEIIYRSHPGTDMRFDVSEGVHLINSGTILEWIKAADLFITNNSTSIFEAEQNGVPSVTYHHSHLIPRDRVEGLENYPEIEHLSEISEELVTKVDAGQRKMEPVYPKYIGEKLSTPGKVVKVLREIGDKEERVEVAYDKMTSIKRFRINVREMISFVVVKTELFKIIKWPRMVWQRYNDIPYYKKNDWKNRYIISDESVNQD